MIIKYLYIYYKIIIIKCFFLFYLNRSYGHVSANPIQVQTPAIQTGAYGSSYQQARPYDYPTNNGSSSVNYSSSPAYVQKTATASFHPKTG